MGVSLPDVVQHVADVYLDGKPVKRGARKLTRADRDRLFWSSEIVHRCPMETWRSPFMTLALVRYFSQETVSCVPLLEQLACHAKDVLMFAGRRAQLVFRPANFPRRAELLHVARGHVELEEFCRTLDIFTQAYLLRRISVEQLKAQLHDLSVFDLLLCASVCFFDRHVTQARFSPDIVETDETDYSIVWKSINDLLIWKLLSQPEQLLRLDESRIGESLGKLLRPWLFDDTVLASERAHRTLECFAELLDMQIELNEFISRSGEAFSFDDAIAFVRNGDVLEIEMRDSAHRDRWMSGNRKEELLHLYWMNRAVVAFVCYVAEKPERYFMGKPKNQESNRWAYMLALHTQLRAREVYGIADEMTLNSGQSVNLFQAFLSLNLMAVFFRDAFLRPFVMLKEELGNSIDAMRALGVRGLLEGMQIRWPITWSGRAEKVANLTGWTVSESCPDGSARMAEAILDFWTYDCVEIARSLKNVEPGLLPEFYERPVLKFGSMFVQLPWVTGLQHTGNAAINNLRRLGARRAAVGEETRRIESNVAVALNARGFRTIVGWIPDAQAGFQTAGEVDVIAVGEGACIVMEVKSTFVRNSQKEAWLHETTSLRKAGQQLQRKLDAVQWAMKNDAGFRTQLGLSENDVSEWPEQMRGWIVDTSIECDHQRFSGFLKLTVEELLIALRDEVHLFHMPTEDAHSFGAERSAESTLYPNGFSARRFIEVIENDGFWAKASSFQNSEHAQRQARGQ